MNDVAKTFGPDHSDTPQNSGSEINDGKRPVNKGIIFSLLVLGLVLTLGFQWLYSYVSDVLAPTSFAYITASGDQVVLDRSGQKTFAGLLSRETDAFESDVIGELDPVAERGVDKSFNQLQNGVDAYLDWYFSVSGSYMRMYVALTKDLDEWSEKQIQERLLEESGFLDSLADFEREYRQRQTELVKAELQETQNSLHKFLQAHGTEILPEELTPDILLLNFSIVTDAPDVQVEIERVENSMVIGGAFGLAARVASLGGVKAATVFARQFTVRVAGHGIRAATSGALSAAATSFTGPGAAVVGAAVTGASIASYIGAEYLALNAQETLYRPKMEQDLRDLIELKRKETRVGLKENTQQEIRSIAQTIQQDVAEQERVKGIPRTYRVWDDPI
ncbi:hypothetical protein [Marinobacter orientalis]|uniref:Uncharacterized protein n=1 Tax=Marinobacter orientalis TaxID=1928859 RepID=A0A7Y0WS42_9GAMM|nr:hypothetical protein [Marinobacter orientalis]NMT63446.1 hypothetical protein [Marinobacter orientalis]TGX48508.1 hypothetical protein DIT72_14030 [Marinobacter orientalis]